MGFEAQGNPLLSPIHVKCDGFSQKFQFFVSNEHINTINRMDQQFRAYMFSYKLSMKYAQLEWPTGICITLNTRHLQPKKVSFLYGYYSFL